MFPIRGWNFMSVPADAPDVARGSMAKAPAMNAATRKRFIALTPLCGWVSLGVDAAHETPKSEAARDGTLVPCPRTAERVRRAIYVSQPRSLRMPYIWDPRTAGRPSTIAR